MQPLYSDGWWSLCHQAFNEWKNQITTTQRWNLCWGKGETLYINAAVWLHRHGWSWGSFRPSSPCHKNSCLHMNRASLQHELQLWKSLVCSSDPCREHSPCLTQHCHPLAALHPHSLRAEQLQLFRHLPLPDPVWSSSNFARLQTCWLELSTPCVCLRLMIFLFMRRKVTIRSSQGKNNKWKQNQLKQNRTKQNRTWEVACLSPSYEI